jgi:tRNA threonylcarbamoyladenosine biosynthesis protein TsaB
MITLAFDMSQFCVSIALMDGQKKLEERFESEAKGLDQRLFSLMQEMFSAQQLDPADLGLIVTTRGPGSFTGLRLGLAAAQGMAHALNIPALGVSVFDWMAWVAQQQGPLHQPVLMALESRRPDPFMALIDKQGNYLQDPTSLSMDAIQTLFQATPNLVFTNVMALREKGYESAWPFPTAPSLALYGQELYRQGSLQNCPLTPLYIRPADVT